MYPSVDMFFLYPEDAERRRQWNVGISWRIISYWNSSFQPGSFFIDPSPIMRATVSELETPHNKCEQKLSRKNFSGFLACIFNFRWLHHGASFIPGRIWIFRVFIFYLSWEYCVLCIPEGNQRSHIKWSNLLFHKESQLPYHRDRKGVLPL